MPHPTSRPLTTRALGWTFLTWSVLALLSVTLAPVAAQTGNPASNPVLIGPIPATSPPGDAARNYPKSASMVDLAHHGYQEREFFLQGTANSYRTHPPETASILSSGHPYKTRLLVRRPRSSQAFNGVVIMEVGNAPLGHIEEPVWTATQELLIREGYAYVRVTVLEQELDAFGSGLRNWNPARYGALDVTDGASIKNNALALDIISQSARAVYATNVSSPLLGPLQPRLLIAAGAAEAQRQLATYYNAIQPAVRLFDGFLLYLGQGEQLRTDLMVPAFKINSETDLVHGFEYDARQPDTDNLRTWEIAGASHVTARDVALREPVLLRDGRGIYDFEDGCGDWAKSRIPSHFALNAAIGHLVNWIEGGPPPPTAPRIAVEDATALTIRLARDDQGNVIGGLQLPQHAVPTAMNRGISGTEQFPCYLYGWHGPFDQETLEMLYPNPENYLQQIIAATNASLRNGYITAHDAMDTLFHARHSIRTDDLLLNLHDK